MPWRSSRPPPLAVTDDGTGFVATAAEAEHSATLTCSVCLELVLPRRKFGVLPNCDHAVCHPCIRTWRGTNAQHAAARQCGVPHALAPRRAVVGLRHSARTEGGARAGLSPEAEADAVQALQLRRRLVPLRLVVLRAHRARRTAVEIVPRTVENVNGAKCMKTYNLSDYLFPEAGADGGEMLLQRSRWRRT